MKSSRYLINPFKSSTCPNTTRRHDGDVLLQVLAGFNVVSRRSEFV
jgi:hypothetical protein